METILDHEALRQWHELRVCMASVRLVAQSPIMIRPVAAARVLVRRVAIRLHAARSDTGDAAALTTSVPDTSPIGTAASGFRAFRELFKSF